MSHGSKNNESRIYVGNLPPDIRSKDVEDLFSKYGKIAFVDLKNKKGPPFAFVEFDDARDAEDAVRDRDGYDYDGYRLRVEFPRTNGSRGGSAASGTNSRSGGGKHGGGKSNYGGTRRTSFRVFVSGLPPTGSWQDLKDHMREAGDVCYADVFKDGSGVVEYLRYDDMKYAIRKLDDSKFRSHEGETCYVRVREDTVKDRERNGRNRSRSRSTSRSRSRSTPPKRSRGSPTYSPARRPRSHSRSSSSSSSSKSSRSRSRSRQGRSRRRSRS